MLVLHPVISIPDFPETVQIRDLHIKVGDTLELGNSGITFTIYEVQSNGFMACENGRGFENESVFLSFATIENDSRFYIA